MSEQTHPSIPGLGDRETGTYTADSTSGSAEMEEGTTLMTLRTLAILLLAGILLAGSRSARADDPPAQPVDADYTAKIREYTTEPFFLTELVDHLPSSDDRPLAAEGARLCRRHAREAHVHERHQRLLPRPRRSVSRASRSGRSARARRAAR